jgi:hypothetical protein
LASSTSKKVLALRFDRETIQGFINPQTFQQPEGIELLTIHGAVSILPYSDVKALCFVRDFDGGSVWKEHRAFATRPKTEGLWVRLVFQDGDSMDGLLPKNLLQLEQFGFTVAPPDPTFHNQRIFVPRAALKDVQALGVIGGQIKRAKAKPAPDQMKMFE